MKVSFKVILYNYINDLNFMVTFKSSPDQNDPTVWLSGDV